MKIWVDIVTPKEVLFFESIVARLKKKHTVLCTSRNYREATDLARIRGFKMDLVGHHGGARISSKLEASLDRMQALYPKIQRFRPDLTVSLCNPDASRISYGLQIPHIGFFNAPHIETTMRLSIPLLTRLLIPMHIPKREFTKYGIGARNIVRYNAMDEFLIIKNKDAPSGLPKMKLDKKRTILFRTYESQASYLIYHTNVYKIIDALLKNFSDYNLIVLGRYTDEIKLLKKKYAGQNLVILDKVVDSKALLSATDLFIGSGGTMTTEAVMRKIPSISYCAVPNLDEQYLVNKRLLVRAKTIKQIVGAAASILSGDNGRLKHHVGAFVSKMSDPFPVFESTIKSVIKPG